MQERYDIAIVGAGLMGSALALWLARNTDYRVLLIERGAPLQAQSMINQRVVALGTKATALLDSLGVFAELGVTHAFPYTRMTVWDEHSTGQLEFSTHDTSLPQLGFMVDSVHCNLLLQQACLQHRQLACRFDCAIESMSADQTPAKLIFSDAGASDPVSARLIVAADGVNSWVRQQAGIFANHRDYQQLGIVARVATDRPHESCAWQRFLPTGPVAFLPLEGNECSIVWSVQRAFGEQLLALPEAEFELALAQALESRLGSVSLCSPRRAFPLKSQRAERYFRANVVLLGDAAHAVHPLAGQGANLGFRDVECLARLLQEAGPERLADAAVLGRYEQRRRRDNEQADDVMTALHSAYQNSTPLWTALRGLGMNLISNNQALRRLLVRQAMGL